MYLFRKKRACSSSGRNNLLLISALRPKTHSYITLTLMNVRKLRTSLMTKTRALLTNKKNQINKTEVFIIEILLPCSALKIIPFSRVGIADLTSSNKIRHGCIYFIIYYICMLCVLCRIMCVAYIQPNII